MDSQHSLIPLSDTVHGIEDFHVLCPDFYPKGIAFIFQQLLKSPQVYRCLIHVHNHGHIENTIENYLIDSENIYLMFCHNLADSGNDAGTVHADYCDDNFYSDAHSFSMYGDMIECPS